VKTQIANDHVFITSDASLKPAAFGACSRIAR
jgi:hypothetical protein